MNEMQLQNQNLKVPHQIETEKVEVPYILNKIRKKSKNLIPISTQSTTISKNYWEKEPFVMSIKHTIKYLRN